MQDMITPSFPYPCNNEEGIVPCQSSSISDAWEDLRDATALADTQLSARLRGIALHKFFIVDPLLRSAAGLTFFAVI